MEGFAEGKRELVTEGEREVKRLGGCISRDG